MGNRCQVRWSSTITANLFRISNGRRSGANGLSTRTWTGFSRLTTFSPAVTSSGPGAREAPGPFRTRSRSPPTALRRPSSAFPPERQLRAWSMMRRVGSAKNHPQDSEEQTRVDDRGNEDEDQRPCRAGRTWHFVGDLRPATGGETMPQRDLCSYDNAPF